MASASSTSGKSSHDSLGYRDAQLGTAGIFINRYTIEELPVGLRQLIVEMMQYGATIPEDSPTAMILGNTPQAYRLAPSSNQTAYSNYALAREVRSQILALESDPETEWYELIRRVFGHFKQNAGPFKTMSDITWNAATHPCPRAQSLSRPKPDLAVGFELQRQMFGEPVSTFSHVFYERLVHNPRLGWNDKVSPSGAPHLVYPFLLLEAKSAMKSAHVAANQLAHGLAFAIGTLRNLRTHATHSPVATVEPLIAFGIATSGRDWTIYVAHELQSGNPLGDIHLCRMWSGDLTVPLEAVELFHILSKIRDWSLQTLRPAVEGWLNALGQ